MTFCFICLSKNKVIQRRQDGKVNFYMKWDHYKIGFGSAAGEYWLGMKWLISAFQIGLKKALNMTVYNISRSRSTGKGCNYLLLSWIAMSKDVTIYSTHNTIRFTVLGSPYYFLIIFYEQNEPKDNYDWLSSFYNVSGKNCKTVNIVMHHVQFSKRPITYFLGLFVCLFQYLPILIGFLKIAFDSIFALRPEKNISNLMNFSNFINYITEQKKLQQICTQKNKC